MAKGNQNFLEQKTMFYLPRSLPDSPQLFHSPFLFYSLFLMFIIPPQYSHNVAKVK